jgi:hypothetical protein
MASFIKKFLNPSFELKEKLSPLIKAPQAIIFKEPLEVKDEI